LLEQAITDQLDIAFLLDSPIFTDRICKESFSYQHGTTEDDYYPELHKSSETYTTEYGKKSIIEFQNDKAAYAEMFGTKFPVENLDSSKNSQSSLMNLWQKASSWFSKQEEETEPTQYSINYDADYLLVEDSNKTVCSLLRLLSQSDNMCYFRSKFIQRMINH